MRLGLAFLLGIGEGTIRSPRDVSRHAITPMSGAVSRFVRAGIFKSLRFFACLPARMERRAR